MWSPEIKNDNYNVLILLAGIVVYAIVSAWMIGADNPIFSFLPFFLPLIIMGWYSIGLMPPLLILLFFSELKLPGVSDRLNLFYALALVALPLLMLRKYPMLRRLQWHAMHRWLILFLVAVLFVIAMRGAGIQALGGETMGGFAYVQIVLLIFMVFLSGTLRLSPKRWKIALVGMCLITALPFLVEWGVYNRVIAAGNPLLEIFTFHTRVEEAAAGATFRGSITRYTHGNQFSIMLFLAVLLLLPNRKMTGVGSLKLLAGLLVSLFIAGLSGHRGAVLLILMMAGAYTWFQKQGRTRRVLVATYGALVVLVPLVLLAGHLPLAVQRSLAWIPFVEISDFAREAASGTSEWRLYVWKMALDNELPRYWLVGKGLAFHPNESLGFMLGDHYAWAVRTRNYHNGPLSLLIVLGLPGFVAFLGFLIIMIRRHLRIARGIWRSEKLAHFHAVMLVFFIVQVVFFIGIFGDVHISVPRLLFLGALLEGLVASDTAGSASSSVYQRSLGVG